MYYVFLRDKTCVFMPFFSKAFLIIYECAKPYGFNRIIFNIYIFIRTFLFLNVYIELDTTHMYLYIESFHQKKILLYKDDEEQLLYLKNNVTR